MTDTIFNPASLANRLPAGADALPFAFALQRHGLMAGLYAPRVDDRQQPHPTPEIYIVVQGGAVLAEAGSRRTLEVGDLAFVEAGETHRFEEMSDDFLAWAIFWGAEGKTR